MCRLSLFRTKAWLLSGRFPGALNSETDRSEQRVSTAEQGIAASASPRLFVCPPERKIECDCDNFRGAHGSGAGEGDSGSGSWAVGMTCNTRAERRPRFVHRSCFARLIAESLMSGL